MDFLFDSTFNGLVDLLAYFVLAVLIGVVAVAARKMREQRTLARERRWLAQVPFDAAARNAGELHLLDFKLADDLALERRARNLRKATAYRDHDFRQAS